jgi:hypothetical protein
MQSHLVDREKIEIDKCVAATKKIVPINDVNQGD